MPGEPAAYTDAQYATVRALVVAVARFFPRVRPFPPLRAGGEVAREPLPNYDRFAGVAADFHHPGATSGRGPGLDWLRVFPRLSRVRAARAAPRGLGRSLGHRGAPGVRQGPSPSRATGGGAAQPPP